MPQARSWDELFGAARAPSRAEPTRPTGRTRGQERQKPLPVRPAAVLNGQLHLLLPVGDLARVMGRSVSHVRLLEKQGLLPPPQARRRVSGQPGRRLYRSDFVLEVARLADEEGLIHQRAVRDISRFSERVWLAHERLQQESAAHRGGGRCPADGTEGPA